MNLFSQIPGGIPYPQTSMEYSTYTPYPPYTPPPPPPPQYYTSHQNSSPTPQNFPSSYSYPLPNTQYSQSHSPNQYPYPQYHRTKPGSIMEFLIQTKSPEELVDYFPKNSICNFCGGGHHSCLCPIPPYDHPYWATAYPTSSSPQLTKTNVSITPTSLPSYAPQESDDEWEEIISEKLSDLEETLKKLLQQQMQIQQQQIQIQQQADSRMQNMENQLGQIAKALSEESDRSHPSDTEAQPEETNMDDHVSESDYDGVNMMDDTLPDVFEDPDENGVNESWDAFMGSDTESGGEVVNVHDICEEEEDFCMVQFDYGVAPTPCFETSFELPVIPRVIKVFTHVFCPTEEDESFILHFCADEGYEDHVLPSWADEFKDLRHLMTFVERKLETLTISAPLQSLLLESLWGSCVGQTTLKIALLGRQPELFFCFCFCFCFVCCLVVLLCVFFAAQGLVVWMMCRGLH
ncbi:unnamed protein product [Cuscuta epithymum]|uniref:Uncharacterized protein n=1 Tax=Cuscuta epithymum TaxID=186058 RepID=A0AAV0G5W2_9ASTE|nr:unnamed protein product [Cuscuta epithymum]